MINKTNWAQRLA